MLNWEHSRTTRTRRRLRGALEITLAARADQRREQRRRLRRSP